MDHKIRVCLILEESTKHFFKVAVPFLYFYQQLERVSIVPTFSPAFGVVSVLDFGYSNR